VFLATFVVRSIGVGYTTWWRCFYRDTSSLLEASRTVLRVEEDETPFKLLCGPIQPRMPHHSSTALVELLGAEFVLLLSDLFQESSRPWILKSLQDNLRQIQE
jgi:hypothetical protein